MELQSKKRVGGAMISSRPMEKVLEGVRL